MKCCKLRNVSEGHLHYDVARRWMARGLVLFYAVVQILTSAATVSAAGKISKEMLVMNDIVFYDPDGCDPSSVASSATSSYIGGTLSGTGDYANVLNAKNADKYLFNGSGNIDTAHWSDGDNSSMKRLLENYGDLAYQLGKTVGIPYIALLVQMRYEDPTSQCGANNFWGNGCPPDTLPGGASIQGKNLGEGFMQYGKTLLEYNGGEFYKPAIGISDPKLYLETLGPLWVNGDPNGAGYPTIEDEKNSIDELTKYINSAEGQAIVKTFGNYSASDGVNAGNAAGGSSLNTSGTISVSSSGSAVNYKGDIILTTSQLDTIKKYQSLYETAANKYGVPWQALATVHYRENSLSREYDPNGQGIFQLYDEAMAGHTYPSSGTATDSEFVAQAEIVAKHLSDYIKESGYPSSSDEAIKYAFFAYNGRAASYISQAIKLKFTAEQAKYGEGSPYVMNRYDKERDPTDAETRAKGEWGQIMRDNGAMEYPANEDFGAFVVFSALAGTGWTKTGGSNNPCVVQSLSTTGNGGNSIYSTAISLAWSGDGHNNEVKPEFSAAAKSLGGGTRYYCDTGVSPEVDYAQDCGVFVSVVVRSSGVDPDFPASGTALIEEHMKSSSLWQPIQNLENESNLQPGDIFVVNRGSGDGANGHIFIYIGDGKIAAASLCGFTGKIQNVYYSDGRGLYNIYRSTVSTGGATGTTGSFNEELKKIETDSGTLVGAAVTAPGNKDINAVQVGGSWSGGRAWSTIKVPLAIAAKQKNVNVGSVTNPYGETCSHSIDSAIKTAITESNNCGAWWLWEALGGDGSGAKDAVQSVIQSGGDSSTTVVGSRSTGEQALTSGKTEWSLAGQAVFAANMSTISNASSVLSEMKIHNAGDGSYGLNTFSSAMTKGGWGSTITRQFGIVKLGNGKCSAIAIGTDAGSSFSTLNQIAQVLKNHENELPSGTCPGGL